MIVELDFPSSEIFYFQQQQFTFPVDTSMNVEIVVDLHIMGVLEIHTFRCEKLVDPDVIQFLHAMIFTKPERCIFFALFADKGRDLFEFILYLFYNMLKSHCL